MTLESDDPAKAKEIGGVDKCALEGRGGRP